MLRLARHPSILLKKSHCIRPAMAVGIRMLAILAAMLCACGAFAETHRLPLFVGATASGQTGVLRVQNGSDESGTVSIYRIDDSGTSTGPAIFTLGAGAAVEFEASELSSSGSSNALTGNLGMLQGDMRLLILTDLSVEVLAYLRTADGTLAVLHDEVRPRPASQGEGNEYRVPVFNPAHNLAQSSRLRLINTSGRSATVAITGRDDSGAKATGGAVGLTLPAGGARTLTAQQLEAGDTGLTGQFGAGTGRWRLLVSSNQSIEVVNLVTSSTGRLDNLSSSGVQGLAPTTHAVFGERFVGAVLMTRSETRRGSLSILAGDRFTEAVESAGSTTNTQSGSYAYRRTGTDAGQLALTYYGGDPCLANLHFTSRTGGWYASRCDSAQDADGAWRGGSWAIADDGAPTDPDVSSPRFPTSGGPGDQSLSRGAAISTLRLPAATGGNGTLTYSLAPNVPGLVFDPATRQLTGTPTMAGVQAMTYTVTDLGGDTDRLRFLIIVRDGESDDCLLGLLVRPGESCAYPGTSDAFSVSDDGSGQFLVISSMRAINIPNRTFNGKLYDFRASHQGDGVWRIDRLAGVAAPVIDTEPSFPDSSAPGGQTYRVGTPIEALTLPAASEGEGTLAYSLAPNVPGLVFDTATRQLTGTPTQVGTHSMTFAVTDGDDDTDRLSFTITVERTPDSPDLIVESPSVSDSSLTTGQSFTLSATLRNRGTAQSATTMLRFYQSSDATISTGDTEIGSKSVASLAAAGTSAESTGLTAPSGVGAYYYGACVDGVSGESDTSNNCSTGVRVTVAEAPDSPDLIVESPSASSSSVSARQSFTLSATVRNQGAAQSATTTLRYYRSSDATISTSDSAVGSDRVAILPASGTSFESVRLTAPSSADTYYYGACVDTVSGESETSNNCSASVSVTVTATVVAPPPPARGPDLVVDSVSVDDSSPEAGTGFTLSARVRNRGNEPAAATTLHYYQSTDATISTTDTELDTDNIADLPASQSSDESASLTAPLGPGTYYYGACVESVADESRAGNNCSRSVRIMIEVDGPDLAVESVSVSNSNPNAGASFTLSARVRNRGNMNADATTLRYYQSSDATISSADDEVGTDSVGELSASQTSNVSESLTAPTEPGSYFFGACVDDVSGESDPNNNCSTGVRVTIPSPDLVVESPSVDDSTPEAGDRFTLSARVRNRGREDSPSTTLRYYQSTDATISTEDDEVGTDSVSDLSPSRSDQESIVLFAPSTPGIYYYGACVDSVTGESDTDNNCSRGVRVTIAAPDLVIQSPSVDDSTPEAGDSFTLRVRVRNSGRGSSPSTTLRYFQSTDATISTDDTEVATDSIGGLSPSESSNESQSLTAPTPGTYYFGACVDDVADESKTDNNCSSGVRVTVPAADLVVQSPSVDDSTLDGGDSFTLSARVRNSGATDSPSTTLRYYQSTDATISTDDSEVGTDTVRGLSPSRTDNESIVLRAPLSPGDYYFGACVDEVSGESDTTNNCSTGVRVTVGAPDLVVESPSVDDSTLETEDSFRLSARVRNRGSGSSPSTTLRYYESSDRTITTSDSQVGTDSVSGLSPSSTDDESIALTAPTSPGTYYFGACVDEVTDESATDNNCSRAVRVVVSEG